MSSGALLGLTGLCAIVFAIWIANNLGRAHGKIEAKFKEGEREKKAYWEAKVVEERLAADDDYAARVRAKSTQRLFL